MGGPRPGRWRLRRRRSSAVAVLKVVGIVGRRLGAGIMQYRLQATYRRRVTRQYLRLPLSWHQRHPTGQLLSNANADVEATWFPIAPLPFAVGVAGHARDRRRRAGAHRPGARAGRLRRLPARLRRQLRLPAPALAARDAGAAAARRGQRGRARELRRRPRGQDAGPRGGGDRAVRGAAGELRDALVAVGRVRGMFDPLMEALPNLGVLAVLLVGTARVSSRQHRRRASWCEAAYLFTLLAFPIRAIGWVLGELPAQRRRLGPGDPVLDAERSASPGHADALDRRDEPGRFAACRTSSFGYDELRRAARRHLRRRRRADGRRRRPDRVRQVDADLAAGPAGRPQVRRRSCSTASTCARCDPAASPPRPRSWRSRRSSSTTPSAAT